MKRIALMLAAVGLGSGCIVSTTTPCDPGALSVDWAFVDIAGTSNLACSDPGLSATITSVDVYVDGYLEAFNVSCTTYGVVVPGLAGGWHDVQVEGFSGSTIITRDQFSVEVCGDTATTAQAGEGEIEFLPAACSGGYMDYSLTDMSPPSPYVISSITTKLGNTTFPCASGVYFPVPYGNYRLDWIEERTSSGALLYGLCTPTSVGVFGPGTTSRTVSLTGTLSCH